MDAPNPATQIPLPNRAPMRIGSYALAVRDLDRCTAFYQEAVGLDLMERSNDHAILGVSGVALLTLERRADLKPDDATQAGLFHTAFILPDRASLGRWHAHAKRIGLKIPRTGDHLVNEAIYYDDPEGNGCECYADRPAEGWLWLDDGTCEITTGKAVDLDTLAREADDDGSLWRAPPSLRIGHINLRVGDYAAAERFYSGVIGFDFTGRRHIDFAGRPNSTITFMSSGRYHHHFAANDFTAAGAGARDPDRAGLASFTIETQDDATSNAVRGRLEKAGVSVSNLRGGFSVRDPWGTEVRVVSAG